MEISTDREEQKKFYKAKKDQKVEMCDTWSDTFIANPA